MEKKDACGYLRFDFEFEDGLRFCPDLLTSSSVP